MGFSGVSIWWWLKVSLNLFLVSYAVYLGIFEEAVWRQGPLLWGGQLLTLLGAAVNLSHFMLLKRDAKCFNEPEHLLTDAGLFQLIRHPMYLGELILVLGIVIIAFNWLSLLLYCLSILAMAFLCRVEDRMLAKQFGKAHAQWAQNTKLLLPFFY